MSTATIIATSTHVDCEGDTNPLRSPPTAFVTPLDAVALRFHARIIDSGNVYPYLLTIRVSKATPSARVCILRSHASPYKMSCYTFGASSCRVLTSEVKG